MDINNYFKYAIDMNGYNYNMKNIRFSNIKEIYDIFDKNYIPKKNYKVLNINCTEEDKIILNFKLKLLEKYFEYKCKDIIILDYNNYSCNMQKIFYYEKDNEKLKITIQKYLKSSLLIAKKDDIYVFKTLFDNNNVILKIYLQEYDDAINEACIGFYGTNILRKLGNPNFAFILAYFKTNINISYNFNYIGENVTNKVTTKPCYHVVYENIPGDTYNKFLENCTVKDFAFSFIQIMIALKHANSICKFTHYDLHTGNIIQKKISDNPFYIKYIIDGKNVYCKSLGCIYTFIDYGMSYVNVNNIDIGNISTGLRKYQIFGDRTFPLHDAYKLLISSADIIWGRGDALFQVRNIIELQSYFTGYNSTIKQEYLASFDEISIQKKYYYSLPYYKNTANISDIEWDFYKCKYNLPESYDTNTDKKMSLDDFINFLIKTFNEKSFREETYKIIYNENELEEGVPVFQL